MRGFPEEVVERLAEYRVGSPRSDRRPTRDRPRASEQPRRPLVDPLEDERPRPRRRIAGRPEDERSAGVQTDDFRRRFGRGDGIVLGYQSDHVALREVLVRRNDPVDVPDVGTDGPLEPVVAVEAAATLSELDEPRPDRLGGGVDLDRVGDLVRRVREEVVARERPSRFRLGRAPATVSGPYRDVVRGRGEERDRRDDASPSGGSVRAATRSVFGAGGRLRFRLRRAATRARFRVGCDALERA